MIQRFFVGVVFLVAVRAIGEPLSVGGDDYAESQSASMQTEASNGESRAISIARDRAQTTQQIHSATLTMLHKRYFHLDRAPLPARAMQDVFDEIENQSEIKAHWIAANLKPMSIDHTPKTDFEKKAAKAIAAGATELEEVTDGKYHRAVAIPIRGGCLSCHESVHQRSTRKKFAALIVSMPLQPQDAVD